MSLELSALLQPYTALSSKLLVDTQLKLFLPGACHHVSCNLLLLPAAVYCCCCLSSPKVSPVHQGAVQLTAGQLLQLLHYQRLLHNLLNWSSKVGS
jgi:hypothetical protein